MNLLADDYEFCQAPLHWGYDDYGKLCGPPLGGWVLVQVVPVTRGGGSYMTGPAGQDHRISSVGTNLVGIYARPMSLAAKFERDVVPYLERVEQLDREAGRFDRADMHRERVHQIRCGWFQAYRWVGKGS